ncbi:MAG: CBS domain-containing protein [Polyangiaceae bacterium]|jgi:CBS domain-containing protein
MALTVDEIMNREPLVVRPNTPLRDVRDLLRSFGIGAVPVVDDTQRPLGVLSHRDLFEPEGTASMRMSRPAMCVAVSTTIDQAARQLALTDRHHLIVVDGSGAVAGMLSTLDLLRGLLGLPTRHPAAFPHWDEVTQVSWTDDLPLDEDGCARAPDAPGFLLIVRGGHGERDRVVWAEPCQNVRARVIELVSVPSEQPPSLAPLSRPGLRFRAAEVSDGAAQQRIAAILRDRLAHVPPPGGT